MFRQNKSQLEEEAEKRKQLYTYLSDLEKAVPETDEANIQRREIIASLKRLIKNGNAMNDSAFLKEINTLIKASKADSLADLDGAKSLGDFLDPFVKLQSSTPTSTRLNQLRKIMKPQAPSSSRFTSKLQELQKDIDEMHKYHAAITDQGNKKIVFTAIIALQDILQALRNLQSDAGQIQNNILRVNTNIQNAQGKVKAVLALGDVEKPTSGIYAEIKDFLKKLATKLGMRSESEESTQHHYLNFGKMLQEIYDEQSTGGYERIRDRILTPNKEKKSSPEESKSPKGYNSV